MAEALHVQLTLFLVGGTYHNATCRYANYVHASQPLYPARITDYSYAIELPDPLLAGIAKRTASVTLSDKEVNRLDAPTLAAILATENPKGRRASLVVWDPATSTTVYTLNGIISSLGQDYRTIAIEGEDPALLQTPVPVTRTLDLYPSADCSQCESKDPPPFVVWGRMPRVTLPLGVATYLRFEATMGGAEGDKFVYADLDYVPNAVVATGDVLVYDIRLNAAGVRHALDLRCSDATLLRTTGTDQNGLSSHPNTDLDTYAVDKFYRREIPLTALVGKTITEYMLGGENNTAATFTSRIIAAYILDVDGNKKVTIFDETITNPTFAYQSRNNAATTVNPTRQAVWDYGPIRTPASGALSARAVYVDGRVRQSADYSLTAFDGWHWVRFTKRPLDAQGRPAKVQADLDSTEFSRNPAIALLFLWGDATMLAKSVNGASFTAAASAYAAIPDYLNLVGGLVERKPALQLLRDLSFRGAYFDLNSAGEITMAVDASSLHTAASVDLGQNDALRLNNAELVTNNSLDVSVADQVKQLDYLAYRDPGLGVSGQPTFLISATRSRATGGATVTVENPYAGTGKMVDRETDYLFKLLVSNDLDIEVKTGVTRGKVLVLGQLIKFYSPKHYFSGLQYLLRRIRFDGQNYTLRLTGYDTNLFTYAAGKVTVSRLVDAFIDYSQTTPGTPTSPSAISFTLIQSTDGTTTSRDLFRVTLPAVNCNELRVYAFRTGISQAQPFKTVIKKAVVLGAANDIEIESPVGTQYDLEFYAYNGGNHPDFRYSLPALLTGITSGTDNTPPSVPVLTNALSFNLRRFGLTWDPVPEKDNREYFIYGQTLTNLVANPSFEDGLTGWTQSGTPGGGEQLVTTTAAFHAGALGLRLITTGTGFAEIQDITVTNGATYTLAGWARMLSYTSGQALLRIDTGAGSFVNALQLTAAGQYLFGSVTFVTVGTTVRVECRSASGGDHAVFFDDIMLVAGTPNPTALIGQIGGTSFLHNGNFARTQCNWYAVASSDKSDNASAKSALLAAPAIAVPFEDLPLNTPLPLTGLTIISSGTYLSSDGGAMAWVRLSWTNPTDPKRITVNVEYRRNGNTIGWILGQQIATNVALIDDLTPGLAYDYQVYAVGLSSVGAASTLTSQVAPGDTTAPGDITTLTPSDAPPRGIRLVWTNLAATTKDLWYYDLQFDDNSGFTSPATARVMNTIYTISNLTPGATWYFRVRGVDYTGNVGNWSSTASRASPRTENDDIGDGTITNVKITGLLTINPSGPGATALFIDNAGAIRLKTLATSPSRIVFEDASAVEKVEISGDNAGNLYLRPITGNTQALFLGSSGRNFASMYIQVNSNLSLTYAQLWLDQVETAAVGTASGKRLKVYGPAGTGPYYLDLRNA